MNVFAIEKPKVTCKRSNVQILLIVAVVVSFSVGLLAGYLAIKDQEKDEKHVSQRYKVDDLLEIFSTEQLKNTTR